MNVKILGGSEQYYQMFERLGYTIVSDLSQADLVCFTGGADVSPDLYWQEPHPYTTPNPSRDAVEADVYNIAKKLGIPMVGICRGAQFLHVMNGGGLYQHVDNHLRPHYVRDLVTGNECRVTSTHHQMMASKVGCLVAVARESTELQCVIDGEIRTTKPHVDVEVVWHEDTKCLCFQPHPEFPHSIEGAESTYLYFKNLLERYYAN